MSDSKGPLRLRDYPDAMRLATANVVDALGTFLGLAALLLIAYPAAGLTGTALVIAANVPSGLLVILFVAPRLQHLDRRAVLLWLNVVGALALIPPLLAPSLTTAVMSAAILGGVSVSNRGVQMAALAESLPTDARGRFYGLVGALGQAVQVIGLATGTALAATLGTSPALAADVLSFLLAGLLIAFTKFAPAAVDAADRAPAKAPTLGEAFLVVWHSPLLRVLAVVSWIGALVAMAPEVGAQAVTLQPQWLTFVTVGSPAGGVVAGLIGTKLGVFASARRSLQLALMSSATLVVTGVGMVVALQQPADSVPRALYGAVANFLVGAFGAWFLGMMAAFAEHTPRQHTVSVGALMSWSVGACAGAGGFLLAALNVGGGYIALGLLLLGALTWARRVDFPEQQVSPEPAPTATHPAPQTARQPTPEPAPKRATAPVVETPTTQSASENFPRK